jgi:hypothetical protein
MQQYGQKTAGIEGQSEPLAQTSLILVFYSLTQETRVSEEGLTLAHDFTEGSVMADRRN